MKADEAAKITKGTIGVKSLDKIFIKIKEAASKGEWLCEIKKHEMTGLPYAKDALEILGYKITENSIGNDYDYGRELYSYTISWGK